MNKITWSDALEAMYGTQISDRQIPVWDHYLKSEKATNDELVGAIELAANEGMKAAEWRVTVRDLRQWLKVYRARRHAEKNIEQNEAQLKSLIVDWREKMKRGASKDDAISAIDCLNGVSILRRNELIREILAY